MSHNRSGSSVIVGSVTSMAQAPKKKAPMLRRRPPAISTAPAVVRPFSMDSDSEEDSMTPCSKYVTQKRNVRLSNGDVALRRALVVFVVGFFVIFASPQYTNAYYGAFATIFAASATIMMVALPSDVTKVRTLVLVLSLMFLAAALCAACFARRTYVDVRNGTCANCNMSAWEIWFWRIHCCLASVALVSILRSLRSPTVDILNHLWRVVGTYFIVVGIVGLADHAMSVITGVTDLGGFFSRDLQQTMYLLQGDESDSDSSYESYGNNNKKKLCSSVKWNLLINTEELAIGLLTSSHRFKLWVWTKAAASANIRVVYGPYAAGDANPTNCNTSRRGISKTFARFWLNNNAATSVIELSY